MLISHNHMLSNVRDQRQCDLLIISIKYKNRADYKEINILLKMSTPQSAKLLTPI